MRNPVCRLVLMILLATAALPVATHASEPGDIVAFFKADDLERQPVSLGDLVAQHKVAVFFWDWRRATSVRAMQALDNLQRVYVNQGFRVVAVEGEGSSVERIARQFRVESTPQVFLLDGADRVTSRWVAR